MNSGTSVWDLIQIILVLAVVFWLTWVMTRFIANRSKVRGAGRFMKVVDRLAISNDKTILMVKIGSDYCVIGATGHGLTLIKTLDAAEAEAFSAAQQPEGWAGASQELFKGMQGFGARLAVAMKRPRKPAVPPKPEEGKSEADSVLDMMNERVRLRKESKWR